MLRYEGRCFVFGDDINTDYIISSRRKRDTLDLELLKEYIMEDIRPTFYRELQDLTILVAGENFGCGSAMEVAAQILPVNNIPVVLAKSFARSYFRNCINNGVLPVEMDTVGISEGDLINIIMEEDYITVHNRSNGAITRCPSFRGEIRLILESGGLVPYMRSDRAREPF